MTTCIIYTRFSPRPDAAACDSCSGQEDICRAYSKDRHWQIGGCFRDENISGKSLTRTREGLDAALKAAEARKGQVLLCYSMSRLARSTKDMLVIADRVQKAKCQLAFVRDQIDTTSPAGRFFFVVMAAVDEMQREIAAERTSDLMLAYQKNGRAVGGKPPFGWARDPADPKRLIELADEQDTLKIIRDWHDQGKSTRDIARGLLTWNRRSRGAKWHPETIRRILRGRGPSSRPGGLEAE